LQKVRQGMMVNPKAVDGKFAELKPAGGQAEGAR
jgi:hypothetical protein